MSAEARDGSLAVAGDSAPPSSTAPAALTVAPGATSSFKPTAEPAPQACSAVAPAVVEEKSAN
jgi:hypothetical protein